MERDNGNDVRAQLEALAGSIRGLTELVKAASAKAVAAPSSEEPKRLRILVEPHAKLVAEGKKTLIVHAQPYKIAGERLYFGDGKAIYGEMVLGRSKVVSLAEFRRLRDKHHITEQARKQWWPRSRRLYAFPVQEVEAYDKPKAWKRPAGSQTFVRDPEFKGERMHSSLKPAAKNDFAKISEAQANTLSKVLALAMTFAEIVPHVVQQAVRLMEPTGATLNLLQSLVTLGPALVKDYAAALEAAKKAKPSPAAVANAFIISERLITQLRRAREFLPKKTHILALSEDAIAYLEGFLALEETFSREGAKLTKSQEPIAVADTLLTEDDKGIVQEHLVFDEKAEKPEGKLPSLKMPDPAFNIARLRDKKETGVLSRLQRTARTGQRQFLLNEIAPTKATGQFVWGVVTLDQPEEYDDLAEVPEKTRSGIDKFSLEEYSTESPVFYMQMRLVAAFDPPLKLAKPLQARRYGPVITLPDALEKADRRGLGPGGTCVCPECGKRLEHETGKHCNEIECPDCGHKMVRKDEITTGDVPPARSDEKPWMSFRGITPEKLKELSNEELAKLYLLGTQLLQTLFGEGKTTAGGGLSREDVENALVFIMQEMDRRGMEKPEKPELSGLYKAGPSGRYAPINPGSCGPLDELQLDELLLHFHEEFVLRAPLIYVVGSIANFGVTKNDVDVLIRGPLDEATAHVLKFRLGRMVPVEIAQRMSFHGGSVDPEDIGMAGPFTAHLPIYDLVVRRRDDFRTIVEMRDAGMELGPPEYLVTKEDPYLKLPKKEQPMQAVLQHHFRGASVHADFRIAANGYLIGYTLADQIAGKVPEPESMEEARRVAASFSAEGSAWNKAFTAPSRVYAATKAPEPKPWIDVEEEFEPGTVGATRFKKGYMVISAKPRVSWGERTSYFHEYFLENDPKFSGLLTFRLLVSEEGKPADPEVEAGRKMPKGVPFWTCMLAKSLLPSVLKPRAVQVGRIPPQGWAYLPPGLKAVVPRQFQYWRPPDVKERREIRDALVAEKFFTEDNIRLVDNQFRRVVTKYYLCSPDGRQDSIAIPNLPRPPTAVQATHCEEAGQEKSAEPVDKARHRRDECMQCKAAPTYECVWAGGRARAWFCAKHFKAFNNKQNEILRWRRFSGGEVGKRYGEAPLDKSGKSPAYYDPQNPSAKAAVGSAPFTLSWQRWKGQTVIRAAPSREVYHLFIQRDGKVEDYQMLGDPATSQKVTAVYQVASGPNAASLMKLSGDVPPGKNVGGVELNPTKDTPSKISVLAHGTIEFLEDGRSFKKFRLRAKELDKGLSGVFTLRPETGESGEGSVWIWQASEEPGEPVRRAMTTGEAGKSHRHSHGFVVDDKGDGRTTSTIISPGAEAKAEEHEHKIVHFEVQPARGHAHDKPGGHAHELPEDVRKEEQVKSITLASGKTLADVQVWDPKKIKPSDDKTHDRERLRPLALYKPMKVAPREKNEFRSNDLDRLFADFATEEMLKIGVYVEPKWNGFRSSIQKDEKGRQLMVSEDIWERRTPIANFLEALPGLKAELDKLPGPYVLDGEFMAVTAGGDPVPRRELADFRSASAQEDINVRLRVFDVLYSPTKGNVMALPLRERLRVLDALFAKRNFTRVVRTPYRLAHSEKELRSAIEWARKIPGSEGAMLKSAEGTVTLRETDSMAKLKMVRELRGIVWDAHPVKDSPGVHNFMYAVGPVSEEEAKGWAETVEVDGKTYVKAGMTFNTKLQAKVGDVIRIDVTEILWDEANPERKRLRGFTPVVIDVADGGPSRLADVRKLLGEGELKKSAEEVGDLIAKYASAASREVRLIKQDEERFVLGVVLVPDEVDSQGDIYDEDTVRKAAHYFMEETQGLGLMHRGGALGRERVRVLESYICPADTYIEGQFVRKGTWLLAARVLDEQLWQAVKEGRLTGWSIEGYALAMDLVA